jgi:hypothetical protein
MARLAGREGVRKIWGGTSDGRCVFHAAASRCHQRMTNILTQRLGDRENSDGLRPARDPGRLGASSRRYNSIVAGAAKDFDGVRQQCRDGLQRLHGSVRASGEIHDEGAAADSGGGAGKRRVSVRCAAALAYEFADAGNEPRANRSSGFGRGVAGAQSCSSRGQHDVQLVAIRERGEEHAQRLFVIGKDVAGEDPPTHFRAPGGDGRAGGVLPLVAGDTVADGNDGDTHGYSAGAVSREVSSMRRRPSISRPCVERVMVSRSLTLLKSISKVPSVQPMMA